MHRATRTRELPRLVGIPVTESKRSTFVPHRTARRDASPPRRRSGRLDAARLAVLALLAVSPAAHGAGLARRMADISTNPSADPFPFCYSVAHFGATFIFDVETPGSGCELFATNGPPESTRPLPELVLGPGDASTRKLGVLGSAAWYVADLPMRGLKLVRSDGTRAGTSVVEFPSLPGWPRQVEWSLERGDHLLLAADDGIHGTELWRTDGTEQGTFLVRDIFPGPGGSIFEYYPAGAVLGSFVYFAARDGYFEEGSSGLELWRTDGTPTGTTLIADLKPGRFDSNPGLLTPSPPWLYFTAEGPDSSIRRLWRTSGTASGTSEVALPSGELGRIVSSLSGGRVLFTVEHPVTGLSLWVTDGTPGGTLPLIDTDPTDSGSWEYSSGSSLGSKAVFFAREPDHGQEPWVSDGTPTGTHRLGDLAPGVAGSWYGELQPFWVVATGAYFVACVPDLGCELWWTDGTSLGTYLLQELVPGPADAGPWIRFRLFGGLVLIADLGEFGPELYWTNGSAPPTRLTDLGLDRSPTDFEALTAFGGGLLFAPEVAPDVRAVWRSDGTESGTFEIAGGLAPYDRTIRFEAFGDGTALVNARAPSHPVTPNGSQLFSTDGFDLTLLGTFERPCENFTCAIDSMTSAGSIALFEWWTAEEGRELWATDGTAAGTGLFADLLPGPESSWPLFFRHVGDQVGFFAHQEATGSEPWLSDGTAIGTDLLLELVAGPASSGSYWHINETEPTRHFFTRFDGDFPVFFVTVNVYDPLSGIVQTSRPFYGSPTPLGVAGERLLLDYAVDPEKGLWATDGTEEGTEFVLDLNSWTEESAIIYPAVLDSRLLVQACTVDHGCELWSSDGTSAGTFRLLDLVPGPGSSFPVGMSKHGDRVYYCACDHDRGCEPWVTDGTAPGTRRLDDIAPGVASSCWDLDGPVFNDEPLFVGSGRFVYFPADDGTGTELWAVPAELFYDGFETGATNRWSASGLRDSED
ncbi:MAG: hypothetical protein AMXMBFR36_03470 [Acidobacteriota bacterium]